MVQHVFTENTTKNSEVFINHFICCFHVNETLPKLGHIPVIQKDENVIRLQGFKANVFIKHVFKQLQQVYGKHSPYLRKVRTGRVDARNQIGRNSWNRNLLYYRVIADVIGMQC